jgi:hypothetical protein
MSFSESAERLVFGFPATGFPVSSPCALSRCEPDFPLGTYTSDKIDYKGEVKNCPVVLSRALAGFVLSGLILRQEPKLNLALKGKP